MVYYGHFFNPSSRFLCDFIQQEETKKIRARRDVLLLVLSVLDLSIFRTYSSVTISSFHIIFDFESSPS